MSNEIINPVMQATALWADRIYKAGYNAVDLSLRTRKSQPQVSLWLNGRASPSPKNFTLVEGIIRDMEAAPKSPSPRRRPGEAAAV